MMVARSAAGFIIAAALLLGSGCSASRLAGYQQGDELESGNGWVLFSVNSSTPEFAFAISPIGFTNRQYRTPLFADGYDFKLMQLPAGSYRINGVYDQALLWTFVQPEADEDFVFAVSPGFATLLGDVILDGDRLSLQPFSAERARADDFLAESFIPLEGVQLVTAAPDTEARFWDLKRNRIRAR